MKTYRITTTNGKIYSFNSEEDFHEIIKSISDSEGLFINNKFIYKDKIVSVEEFE